MVSDEMNEEKIKKNLINKKEVKITLIRSENDKSQIFAKNTTKIGKILKAFCSDRNVNSNDYRLIKNGKYLEEDRCLDDYNIQNNDEIDIIAKQSGGN